MSSIENRNTDTPPKWRAWLHIGMGVVYLLFAAMVYNFKKFGNVELGEVTVYGMSGLLVIYGVFRIWRGIADLRYINSQQ
ncbi:MAG: hypothetical protein V4561_13265 [Bacteroidota bacterium]|jgi:hypothetical protein